MCHPQGLERYKGGDSQNNPIQLACLAQNAEDKWIVEDFSTSLSIMNEQTENQEANKGPENTVDLLNLPDIQNSPLNNNRIHIFSHIHRTFSRIVQILGH